MLNIKNWQENDFLDKANHQALKKQVDDFLFYNMETEAFDLYGLLAKKNDIVKTLSDSDLKDKYFKLLQTLKFIALPRLEDDAVLNIVKSEIADAFDFNQEDLDIKEKMRKKLTTVALMGRDDYKRKLTDALRENKQIITNKKTVADWVNDYHKFMADNRIDQKLIKAEYLYKNKDIVSLLEKEREKVKILLDLYDAWQKSSFTVAGREDAMLFNDDGKMYGVYKGEIFEIGGGGGTGASAIVADKIVASTEPKQVKSELGRIGVEALKKEPIQSQNIEAVRVEGDGKNKLHKKFDQFLGGGLVKGLWTKKGEAQERLGKDLKALRNNFYHAVNNGQKEEALGALLALAENGQIRAAFGDDERFVKFWGGYLEKNTPLSLIYIGDTSPKLGEEDVVARFENDPAGAKFLAMFFKYILEQRLKLSAEQAVMMGVIVSNLARRAGELEYQEMAYGDMETQKFRWNF